jgi:hypothetical protein
MSNLTLSSFYPNNLVSCSEDLPFEDGTYEVIEREAILNFFLIKNRRIQYHIVFNMERRKRLMTWHFEYLNKNGQEINNIWRQTMDTDKCDLYFSSHWDLYPEEHKARLEFSQASEKIWNNFVNHIGNCRENKVEPF